MSSLGAPTQPKKERSDASRAWYALKDRPGPLRDVPCPRDSGETAAATSGSEMGPPDWAWPSRAWVGAPPRKLMAQAPSTSWKWNWGCPGRSKRGGDGPPPPTGTKPSRPGLGMVRQQVRYQTAWRGGRLLVADRFLPNPKTYSACGTVGAKLTWPSAGCEGCGSVIGREVDAAENLLMLALHGQRGWWSRGKAQPCRARGDGAGEPGTARGPTGLIPWDPLRTRIRPRPSPGNWRWWAGDSPMLPTSQRLAARRLCPVASMSNQP
jgi:hypothetical protein